ncbi:MAG: fimbrial protein [Rhizobiaceae bacterium]|nr:fimbrial protein [Rhizobiaceae bacterium]MBL4732621.1 fimbrial protein [Rhizobiaceae bacterium]
MSAADNSSIPDEEKPLDPAVERVRKRMLRMMIVSVGVMLIGLMAVLGAIVYKLGQYGNDDTTEVASSAALQIPESTNISGQIDIPDGASILSATKDGQQILLTLKLADGKQQLWLYDIATNRQFAIIEIK